MTDSAQGAPSPLLVLVRDEESGWAHVARQPRDPHKTPHFTGFLHTTTEDELVATMSSTGYSAFATYLIDEGVTTYWFEPASTPTPPGVPRSAGRPTTTAA